MCGLLAVFSLWVLSCVCYMFGCSLVVALLRVFSLSWFSFVFSLVCVLAVGALLGCSLVGVLLCVYSLGVLSCGVIL